MSTQSDGSIPSREWALTPNKTLHQTPVFDLFAYQTLVFDACKLNKKFNAFVIERRLIGSLPFV